MALPSKTGEPDPEIPYTRLSEADIRELKAIALALPRNSTCVAIGSYLGASAAIIRHLVSERSVLNCIDTWVNDGISEGRRDACGQFIKSTDSNRDNSVSFRSDSVSAAQKFTGQLDFLFIDGDHSYEGCKADIDAWLPKLKQGAVVAFHDFGWAEGVQRAVGERFFPFQDGEGHFSSNLYWARFGGLREGPKRTVEVTGHAVVISRSSGPTPEQISRYQPGLGGLKWSWVAAGVDRDIGGQVNGEGAPALHAASAVGLLAGRHKGLEVASDSDVVIYLDDDVTLPPGWASKMLEPFADPDVHFVGCRYLPNYKMSPPGWLEGLWWDRPDGFRTLGHLSLLDGGDVSRLYSPLLVWGLCFAARRRTIVKLGGFNPDGYPWPLRRFRGDGENGLSAKAMKLGLKAYYQAKAYVLHDVPRERMKPKYFLRRSFLQGISDSYTAVRTNAAAPLEALPSWKDKLRPAKWRLQDMVALARPTTTAIRQAMARAHVSGRFYHEQQLRVDPDLLGWVLKANYGDGELPYKAVEDQDSFREERW